jgi:hypothetical protein
MLIHSASKPLYIRDVGCISSRKFMIFPVVHYDYSPHPQFDANIAQTVTFYSDLDIFKGEQLLEHKTRP